MDAVDKTIGETVSRGQVNVCPGPMVNSMTGRATGSVAGWDTKVYSEPFSRRLEMVQSFISKDINRGGALLFGIWVTLEKLTQN
jgi:hypothetical protein